MLFLAASLFAVACGESRDVDESALSTTTLPSEPVERSDVAATLTYEDGTTDEVSSADLDEMDADLNGSTEFKTLVFGDPSGEFATSEVLSQMIGARMLVFAAEADGGDIDEVAVEEGKASFVELMLPQFVGSEDPEAEALSVAESTGSYFEISGQVQAAVASLESTAEGVPVPCVSHILVEEEAEADDLMAQLADGGDFAELAIENSTDPGSGSLGGELGCQPPEVWTPEFKEAVIAATPGEYVGPVQSDFGYHIIVVTGEEVDTSAAVEAAIQNVLAMTEVEIDPAIGVWSDGQVLPAE